MMKERTTAPTESVALTLGLWRVKSVMIAAAASGRKRTTQARFSGASKNMFVNGERADKPLELHRCQVFHMSGLSFAVKRHDQRQTHRHLGRRHRNNKKHHDLP